MQIVDSALENLRLNYDELFAAEKKVADFILENVERVVDMNVSELSEASGVSEATIIRMCKHLGYKGFYQMKLMLAHNLGKDMIIGNGQEQQNPESTEDFFKCLANNMYNIGTGIDESIMKKCVELILKCNTVHIMAAGNTIPSAIDFAFRLGRIEIATTSSISDELELSSINLGKPEDIVIGISHSGGSKAVIQAFEIAGKRGMTTIAVTDIVNTPLGNLADFVISSGVETSSVYVFGAESHIHTAAILDAIIYFLVKAKKDAKKGSREMFLPETKLDSEGTLSDDDTKAY